MTQGDRMEILRRAVAEHGQAEVARRIGYKASTICQVLSGKYGGSPDLVLERVEAEFGVSTVTCPVLGEVPLITCIEEREKPFKATSSQRVKLWRACQACARRKS